MKSFPEWCGSRIARLRRFFFNIACWLSLFLVLLTTEQVIARYFFGASSIGLQELEWHLFGFLFLFGMAETLDGDQHVRVDLFYSKMPIRGRAFVDFVGGIFLLLPTCALLMLYGYLFARAAFDFENTRPGNFYTASYISNSSTFYPLLTNVEMWVRQHLLIGEISPDPDGLEARWIIKAAIPFGFLLLVLQALISIGRAATSLFGRRNGD